MGGRAIQYYSRTASLTRTHTSSQRLHRLGDHATCPYTTHGQDRCELQEPPCIARGSELDCALRRRTKLPPSPSGPPMGGRVAASRSCATCKRAPIAGEEKRQWCTVVAPLTPQRPPPRPPLCAPCSTPHPAMKKRRYMPCGLGIAGCCTMNVGGGAAGKVACKMMNRACRVTLLKHHSHAGSVGQSSGSSMKPKIRMFQDTADDERRQDGTREEEGRPQP